MTKPLLLIQEAKTDAREAYQWYEEQAYGLGVDFLRCVEAVLDSVQRTPQLYPVVYETYRRALVRRFPFAVFFEYDVLEKQCIVYSIFHCSQSPEKWQKRLR